MELPKVDGYLEAGIAAGVDPMLPDADKLPVHGNSTREVYNSAICWAANRNFHDDRTNTMFVSGVAAIVGCSMLRTRNGVPDGDWYESSTAITLADESKVSLLERINRDTMTSANTVVCATKVNYWLMNHHVGQTGDRNTAAGYVQKVLTLKYGNPLPSGMVQAAHMLGHYASTRFILRQAGIPNILETESRVGPDAYELRFADDAKLRFQAPPAGTHRMAVCHEAARRLAKYQFSFFCPDLNDFSVLPGWKSRVMENPAIFHIGALYLTGRKDNDFTDNIFENFIGRLGAFVQVMAPKSTLCASPHFSVSKVESAPDYDTTWRNVLTQIHRTREQVSAQQLTIDDIAEAAKEAARALSDAFSQATTAVPSASVDAPN